jgi:hypothetical protein
MENYLNISKKISSLTNKNPNWIHVSYVNPKSNRNRTLRAKKRGSQTTYFVI